MLGVKEIFEKIVLLDTSKLRFASVLCLICIKNQYENNNILGLDISELRFGSVQNLILELETRPLTEPFSIHDNIEKQKGKTDSGKVCSY